MRHFTFFLAAAISALVSTSGNFARALETSPATNSQLTQPRVMLWSWQKIENLRAVDTKRAGVAFLVGRFVVDGSTIVCEPRLARLELAAGCYREAVARVEMKAPPADDQMMVVSEELAKSIARLAVRSKVNAVQIDYDARQRERSFYLQLLRDLRKALPEGVLLSTTALASWSQGDLWLKQAVDNPEQSGIKVDHVVPMFFTMGAGRDKALKLLEERLPATFNKELSIGLSLSDSAAVAVIAPRLDNFRHIYLFCSPGWSRERLDTAGKLIDIKLIEEKKIGNF